MRSTTASDDALLLDEIERRVMDWEEVNVQFKRIAIPGSGPSAWKVSFKVDKVKSQSKRMISGGGATLREAFENAFVEAAVARIE